MIRPDVELIRSIADTVATQEGRRGGSVSAHTLALETKTLAAYVEHLETEVDLLRRERNEESYRQAGSRHRILALLAEHAGCLHTRDLGIEIREILGMVDDE